MTKHGSSISLRFFEGAIWSAVRNLLQTLLSLTALAVVARELGPQAYGVFGMAMLVIGVAEMVVGGALTDSLIQRKDLNDGHVDATFWLSLTCSIIFGALIVVFAVPLARLAGSAQAVDVLIALAFLLPITVGSRVPMALLARDMRFRASSLIGALATILSCTAGIVLALRGAGIWTLVVMEAVRSCTNLVGAFIAVSWRPGRRGSWRLLRELSRFNASTLSTYAVGYADLLLPRLLVSHLMGAHILGLFMLATRVATELSNLLTEPLHGVSMAACARAQDARDELHRIIIGLYQTSRLLVFPVFLGMAALAPALIPLLFGARWEAAVPAVQILMLGGLRLATGAFNASILFGVGRPQLSLTLFGVGCLLHIVLFPALAPLGLVGASIAMLGRQFGNWPLACLLIKRATGLSVRRQIGGGLPVLLSAVTMAAVVWGTAHLLEQSLPGVAVVLASIVAGVVSYVAALRVFAPSILSTAAALLVALVRLDRSKLETVLSQAA